MKTTREFCPANRYTYDFGACSPSLGWGQVDTEQDAEWFGIWAHPGKLLVFSYVEGDCTLHECETAEEFAAELRTIEAFEIEQGRKPARIDPGLNPECRAAFESVGLADMLH